MSASAGTAQGTVPVPPTTAPFADKMAYYRSQHTSSGVRATHLFGIPAVAASLPLLVFRPRLGVRLFGAGWLLQVFGHVAFEHNSPALTKGPITYQLCGLAFWCEEMAELISGPGPARAGGARKCGDGRRLGGVASSGCLPPSPSWSLVAATAFSKMSR